VDVSAARRRLGNVLRTREAMRRVWVARWWDALRQDALYTWRSWRRRPAFAVAAVLVLALGLGSSTALFAALDRVLFRPLPYAEPDRVVSVGIMTSGPFGRVEVMPDKGYLQAWRTTPAPFEAVTSTAGVEMCDIAETQPEQVRCARVEHNVLRALGVSVVAGRDFAPEDDVRGAPAVALISHGLWVRRYGADARITERTLSLDSTEAPLIRVPIAGVLPADFEMPLEHADILLPAQQRPVDPDQPQVRALQAFARLKPDITPESAERMLTPQLREMVAFMPWPAPGAAWKVRPIRDRRAGDAARAAWLLAGAVAVFLLIACVNVVNLMLVRVTERQREFAVRAAIGAGTIRLARLTLAESLLLSVVAGGLGLLLAFALLRTFVAVAPAGIPGIADASIDTRVFVVAVLLIVVTGIAIGLWPAISVLKVGGLRSTSAWSCGARPRVRFALVTTQIALTLALLGGSALLLRSLWNVVSIPLGFSQERIVTLAVGLSATRYPTPERRSAFFEELLARAGGTPGALSATLSSAPPPLGVTLVDLTIDVEGRSVPPGTRQPAIRIREVTPGYFETFRIPVISGRRIADTDRGGEPAVVLSKSAERILFAGEEAVGRRIRFMPKGPWHTVVGVAADIRNGQSVIDAPAPEAYLAARRDSWRAEGHLALRTMAGPADAAAVLRHIVAELDPLLPATIQAVDEQVARLTERPRFIASLLSAFAALALLLAAAGLYSVVSYLVAQRSRDIGVRMAIGASPRDVAQQVVGEAGRWIVAGAVAGAALGWMGTRALQSQLYQVQALDLWSWTGALLALAMALMLAVFRPAYRAAHVDPVAALRAD
jgi:predicted permease